MKLKRPRRSLKFDGDDYGEPHVDIFMSTTDDGKPIFEGPIIHIIALSYDLTQETGFGSGAGRTPTSLQRGNASISGSYTLKQDSHLEFNRFWNNFDWEGRFGIANKDRRLIDIPPYNIKIVFAEEEDGTEHSIAIFNIVQSSLNFAVNDGDLSLPRQVNYICADIHEDGFPLLGTVAPLT